MSDAERMVADPEAVKIVKSVAIIPRVLTYAEVLALYEAGRMDDKTYLDLVVGEPGSVLAEYGDDVHPKVTKNVTPTAGKVPHG